MLSAINPTNSRWAHTFIVEPFLEGTARLNQVWSGVSSNPTKLNAPLQLKERIVSLVTGLILLLPLVNIIVWLAWQTFGRPEKLSDPYCPQGAVSVQVPTPALPAVMPVPPPAGARVEQFAYIEKKVKEQEESYEVQWQVHNGIYVSQQSPKAKSTSLYTPAGTITEFHHIPIKGDEFHIWLRGSRLEVRVGNASQEFELKGRSWIQQPLFGLRKFALSDQKEFRFFGISSVAKYGFNPPYEVPFVATKVGVENGLTKVKVTIDWRWPLNIHAGDLWFDAAGNVVRFNNALEGKEEVRKQTGQ